MLKECDIANYQRDGYLLLENFVTNQQCDELTKQINYWIENGVEDQAKTVFDTDKENHTCNDFFRQSADTCSIFYEKSHAQSDKKSKKINKIGHALHDLDPVFNKFSRQIKIAQLVNQLGMQSPLLMQSMYIFKQPYIGGEVDIHQDSSFLMTKSIPTIGLWFALEDATLDNGCLWALPGSHTTPLKYTFECHQNECKIFPKDETPWNEQALLPLEVKKGALIVLHGHLAHASYQNKTHKSRHAYTLHLVDAQDEYLPTNWLQKKKPATGFPSFI